jgi:hypothetical protein
MVSIAADGLDRVLTALGAQLRARDASAHLVVIGGSGLLALGAVDRPTRDVDVVAQRGTDGGLELADPLPAAVVAAAAIVARDFALDPDWLNAAPTSLLAPESDVRGLPAGFADRLVTRRYGPALAIDVASRFDQIHLKLYAYATRFEPRDLGDLRALAPAAEELRAAVAWIHAQDAPGEIDVGVERALRDLGVEDAVGIAARRSA